MKKLLILLAFISGNFLQSQILSLNDLFAISNKRNWDEVNEMLIRKGWEYHESSKGDDEHYNTITWSFEKNRYNDKAQGWFHLYTFEDLPNKISFTFFNKQTFTSIKSGLASAAMKLVENSIEDNQIISKYSNTNFILTISTEKRIKEDDYDYDSESAIVAYSVILVKRASVYDEDNGPKKSYDDFGNLLTEFTLKDGKISGEGKRYFANGKVNFVANFVNGKKQGIAREYDENGALVSEFTYVNDEQNGKYKIYEANKVVLVGYMLNGEKSGEFTEYSDEKLLRKYTLLNGMYDGHYTENYYDGDRIVLRTYGNYKSDTKDGLWQTIRVLENKIDLLDSRIYSNGILEGPFKEVSGDSIVFGTMENGMLEGKYMIYRNLNTMLTGFVTGDTAKSQLVEVGEYTRDQKAGLWSFFDLTGTLITQGRFAGGLEVGEWNYFYPNYVDENGKLEPYAGKLYLTENYLNGVKDGKEIRYYSLRREVYPCFAKSSNSVTSSDTCNRFVFSQTSYTANYRNNLLHGHFEQRDSTGFITFSGDNVDDKKNGYWVECFLKHDRTGKPYYNCFKGNYKGGKEIGKWEEYWGDNLLHTTYEYVNGKLNGPTKILTQNGVVKTVYHFTSGKINKIQVNDTLRGKIASEYDFEIIEGEFFKCKETNYFETGKITQEYRIYYSGNEEKIDHWQFLRMFYSQVKNGSNLAIGFKDGAFNIYDVQERVLIDGAFFKDRRVGVWQYYYYELNIKRELEISNGQDGIERFTQLDSGKLYNGKFAQYHANGQKKLECKVKDGLKNGKEKQYSETGELIKTVKYEKGIALN